MGMKIDDRGTLEERLEAKTSPEPNSGCWLWTGAVNNQGYPQIHNMGKTELAHRLSYEVHVGPIPIDLQLDHKCRVPCCINPDHLEPVTSRENYLRGIGPEVNGDFQRAKTHCPQGHPYLGDNLYVDSRGWRFCRTCDREKSRRFYARKKMRMRFDNAD